MVGVFIQMILKDRKRNETSGSFIVQSRIIGSRANRQQLTVHLRCLNDLLPRYYKLLHASQHQITSSVVLYLKGLGKLPVWCCLKVSILMD
jgi:hypothetical protein